MTDTSPDEGLAPFAAWAAEQIAALQALAREVGELRRSTMPLLRQRVRELEHERRLWLAAAWAWWRAREYAMGFRFSVDRALRWRRLAEKYLTESERQHIEVFI